MSEMTRLGRITTASRKLRADRLPFFHYWRHSQIGWAERECRNRGMGINWMRPPYVERLHDVLSEGRQIRIDVEAGGVSLDVSKAMPCGLIVNELITNSFKYAFPPSFDCLLVRGEPCTIRITLPFVATNSTTPQAIFAIERHMDRLARSLGIFSVHVVDPSRDPEGFEKLLAERLASDELSLIIGRRPCLLAAGKIKEYEAAAAAAKSCDAGCDCG